MDIKVSRRSLDRFRRRARKRYPVEYLEILLGHVTGTEIEIVKSVPIKHTCTLTSDDEKTLDYKAGDLEFIQLKAEKEGLVWIGSIHSHPDSENTPSESDNQSVIDDGEHAFGIYSFHKNPKSGHFNRSKTCFYFPQIAVAHTTS
jgi:proteasome lid subunit RPN8/RPN11